MKTKIIETGDSSKTIYLPDLDETYHSRHGAIQESKHVFIESGLSFFKAQSTIKVFEMGFGTGLNALLAAEWAEENNILVEYTGIEKFPLDIETATSLYNTKNEKTFEKIVKSTWEKINIINPMFSCLKTQGDLEKIELENNQFDLIFYDAFGPKTQPELWGVEPLEKMYHSLKNNGILVTYCAQGQFKRNLKTVGFQVEELPGPPGKREMTRGHKV